MGFTASFRNCRHASGPRLRQLMPLRKIGRLKPNAKKGVSTAFTGDAEQQLAA